MADVTTHAANGAPVVYCHCSNYYCAFFLNVSMLWLRFPSNGAVNLIYLVLACQLHCSAKWIFFFFFFF